MEGREIKLNTISKPMPKPNLEKLHEDLFATGCIVDLPFMQEERLLESARALYNKGFRFFAINVSFDVDQGALAIASLVREFGEDVHVGGISVLTTEQARRARMAGADFMILPNVSFDVVMEAQNLGVLTIPSVMTPTEVYNAHFLCCDTVCISSAADDAQPLMDAIRDMLPELRMISGVALSNEEQRLSYAVASVLDGTLEPLKLEQYLRK